MCMYVYVCVCMCMYVYVCVCMCMYVCMYVWMYVCLSACMYVGRYVRTYVCIYVFMYIYICIYVYVYPMLSLLSPHYISPILSPASLPALRLCALRVLRVLRARWRDPTRCRQHPGPWRWRGRWSGPKRTSENDGSHCQSSITELDHRSNSGLFFCW